VPFVLKSVLEAIKTRRSVKQKFIDKPVPDGVLNQIIESATWAPSAHNSQPWSFVIIRDKSTKRKLAENMAVVWGRDLQLESKSENEHTTQTSSSIERISNAPVVLVVCLRTEHLRQYIGGRKYQCEHTMAIQSVAAAIQNLLLAAHALNIGSCWMCAPLFCQETVRETLGIPEHVEPQALVLLGYFEGSIEPPLRRQLSKVIHMDGW
jgi:F420 biosynthesis protein FbiB-like protein